MKDILKVLYTRICSQRQVCQVQNHPGSKGIIRFFIDVVIFFYNKEKKKKIKVIWS